jgi:hypothetical protein
MSAGAAMAIEECGQKHFGVEYPPTAFSKRVRWIGPRSRTPHGDAGQWPRGFTATLAQRNCAACHGTGQASVWNEGKPCACVARTIFRVALARYFEIGSGSHVASVRWGASRAGRPAHWSYPGIEFRADFELTALRVLDPLEAAVFWLHLIGGREWRICCARLQLSRGNFFHAVYRAERKMGIALRIRGLFPIDEYMSIHQQERSSGEGAIRRTGAKRAPY